MRLANYKVQTNQIDIPMSRLQIKTLASTSASPELPRLPPRAANTSQRRIPLPSTATALPDLRTPEDGGRRFERVRHVRIPSSPPPYLEITKHHVESALSTKENDVTSEDCMTPILPSQRQGLLYPPNLGSPVWNDLTSSVVKGRAADGLLSLMRQQN